MQGLMMNTPLTLTPLLERAARLFPKKEIVSKTDTGMHRYTYADFHARVHRLAWALRRMGIQPGDRVGTLCWNSYRHLELYFARHLLRRRSPHAESAPGATTSSPTSSITPTIG